MTPNDQTPAAASAGADDPEATFQPTGVRVAVLFAFLWLTAGLTAWSTPAGSAPALDPRLDPNTAAWWQLSSLGGNGPLYHVVMTESAAVLSFLYTPRVIVPISSGEPHTYRIEVYPDKYFWYIDGVVVDSGVPEGSYPDPNAAVVFGPDGYEGMTNTTAFDSLRFGEIPQDASGEYDDLPGVTRNDYYFVHDCLNKDGPGIFGGPNENAGPGCRFTDFDADTDVDLLDFAEFANHFTGSQ